VSPVFVLIASYLLLVFVLPLALSAVVGYRALPAGRRCPRCSGETLQLRRPPLRALNTIPFLAVLQQRWCLCCGWEGLVRLPRARRGRGRPRRAARAEPTQTLDVRLLTVDGAPWRVMLQCWAATGLFYGRLIFVAPSGRLWLDAVEAFSGNDEHEVLGQALSLPEPLLASRLRRLVR
jgi:hypothetical protein